MQGEEPDSAGILHLEEEQVPRSQLEELKNLAQKGKSPKDFQILIGSLYDSRVNPA